MVENNEFSCPVLARLVSPVLAAMWPSAGSRIVQETSPRSDRYFLLTGNPAVSGSRCPFRWFFTNSGRPRSSPVHDGNRQKIHETDTSSAADAADTGTSLIRGHCRSPRRTCRIAWTCSSYHLRPELHISECTASNR